MSGPAPKMLPRCYPGATRQATSLRPLALDCRPFRALVSGSTELIHIQISIDPYSNINETLFSLRTIGPLQQLFAQFTSA